MSKISADDQLKFLISCIKFSNNGKVDFQSVASDCGIVSKAAAGKRYERLLKANGIKPSDVAAGKPSAAAPSTPTGSPKKTKPKGSASAKKRKLKEESDEEEIQFDESLEDEV